MEKYEGHDLIGDKVFQEKPDKGVIERFVSSILNACLTLQPRAISVPQLPHVNDTSRNKINRAMASATAKWRGSVKFGGQLILPAVFSDQQQLNLKTARDNKHKLIVGCLEKSGADGIWTVDSSLQDQAGSPTFRNKRFPALISFQEEITAKLPKNTFAIAGPYWGVNLALWARGLCQFPAIGVGGAYQYHISGGIQRVSQIRVALPPLLRWARVGADLREWLDAALSKMSPSDPSYADLAYIEANYTALTSDRKLSRRQIAEFYKKWLDELGFVPGVDRSLHLYKMLSSAYVLGRSLPTLPSAEGTARRPERIAEYLMHNCL